MANVKISELNSLTKKANDDLVPIVDTSANETKKISIQDLVNNNVSLIAVSSTAPDECVEGDKYFNTTTNLIYTATDTDTWSSTGESPIEGIFYIVFEEQTTYAYNGTTLISVGGGAGSGGGDNEPIGKVVPMVLETAPDGYLLCDGSIYTKSQYPDLFKIMKNTVFQTDDEEFQVPNIQGKVIVGKKASDTDFAFIGKDGGEKTHQLTESEMPSHSHYTYIFDGTAGGGNHFDLSPTKVTNDESPKMVGYTSNTGGNQAHNNVQPYTVLNYFIKAQKTSGDVVLSEDIKIGTIFQWSGSTAPTNYMICDGSAISRTNYADLFSIIGTTYGNGDGSTTFNLPDFRGNVAVGYKSGDSEFGTLGGTGGSKELQEHTHNVSRSGYWSTDNYQNVQGRECLAIGTIPGDPAKYLDVSKAGTGNSGNLQPYQVVNYIIKVSGTTQLSAQVVNTYNTSDSDTYSCEYVNGTLGTQLFSGDSSSATLSDSSANYEAIEILYKSSNNVYGSTGKIYSPNGKVVGIVAPYNINDTIYNKQALLNISGTSISIGNQKETQLWSGVQVNSGSYFTIIKVVGYKNNTTTSLQTRNLQESRNLISEEENFEDIEPIEEPIEDENR